MKKRIIKLLPYLIISIILIVGMLIKVYADYLYSSNEVYYENNSSTLTSTDLQSAIEELDSKCETRIAASQECPEGYKCTEKTYICKRATTLHTETCNNGSSSNKNFCYANGYYSGGSKNTTTVTYGNTSVTSGTLTSGDAFDCDVNGNGQIDTDANGKSTERFYYVSDYYDTQSKTFNSDYAVLIYYSDVDSGVASPGTTRAYDSSGYNYYGPRTAITHLPTTSQWSNISLYKTSRAILAEYQSTHDATSTSGGTLPTAFSYSGYAARLLTAQELMNGCGLTQVGSFTTGELYNCEYLMENTKFTTSSYSSYGPWLETPRSVASNLVWFVTSDRRYVYGNDANDASYSGVRPAIEILKTQVSY